MATTGTDLDLESVRAFLRTRCDADIALDRLEVSHVTVGPDGPVCMLYEVPGPHGPVLCLAARRVEPAEGPTLAATINRRWWQRSSAAPAGGFAEPALYAPALHLLFQVFPADWRLESLPAAADGRMMAPVLETALASRTGGARVGEVTVEVVRYKPERKCLFRYVLTWAAGETSNVPAVVYGKVAGRPSLERTRQTLERLRRAGGGGAFDLPEPLGIVPALSMELFSRVPGVPLSDLIAADDFPGLCTRVGAGLHRFHTLPVVLDAMWDVAEEAARLAASVTELTCLLPAARERIADLKHTLAARLAGLPPLRHRPMHGDFHGDNVLVDGTRIGVVDLEDCALGDPAADVGSMWAQLTWLAIKAGARPTRVAAGRSAFLDGYLRDAETAIAARVPLHAALHAFLYAYRCLRHPRRRARHEQAQALLAISEELLERREVPR